jgi:ribosomal protein S18 acetylase RimI-like enzyme
VIVRQLGPGDEVIVEQLAEAEGERPQTALLRDDRTIFLAALEGEAPIGFLFGYDLPRRRGSPSIFFVYEVDVQPAWQRRGVATQLFRELERLLRARRVSEAFVLTSASNEPAMRFYESVGGVRPNDDDVMWDFRYADN